MIQHHFRIFFTVGGVRFRRIYDAANNIIEGEIRDANFDAENVVLGEGLKVEVMKNAYNQDDVIILKDTKSLVNKLPYEFMIGRRNRMPVLNYISPTSMIKRENENITAEILIPGYPNSLNATDPDEDVIGFDSYFIDMNIPTFNRMRLNEFTGKTLNQEEIIFNIIVSDGQLEDYQSITVTREDPDA